MTIISRKIVTANGKEQLLYWRLGGGYQQASRSGPTEHTACESAFAPDFGRFSKRSVDHTGCCRLQPNLGGDHETRRDAAITILPYSGIKNSGWVYRGEPVLLKTQT